MQRPREAELQEGQGAYQEATPEEAADVLELMEEHEPRLNNSVAFAEQLGQELQELDEGRMARPGHREAKGSDLDIDIPPEFQDPNTCYRKLQAGPEQLILFETLKQSFESSLINHITNIFEVQNFFEGVKAHLAQGVKEEEVSFHLDYSKQELQKVIKKYPGKEVRRALESLYRTMHKSLSPEENLVPVLWKAMEQEFTRQYREFEELVQSCYAGLKLQRVAVTQVQDLTLCLVEPHPAGPGLAIQLVQIPLQSLPVLQQIKIATQLVVT
ncbi:hypothetical protein TURU_093575 [Turdus rufiventris]|nr:hypothetical protein TURU_093575 [Turdus rufiventris]